MLTDNPTATRFALLATCAPVGALPDPELRRQGASSRRQAGHPCASLPNRHGKASPANRSVDGRHRLLDE